ncbi:hypothetical protein [Haloarchaeobius sp. TZWSO28]|uniref:hypothetical protein n=1 Tax=Haloarchaeobius sp. TZWSO28 TaxID=3446119 RepID=UPI003EB86749
MRDALLRAAGERYTWRTVLSFCVSVAVLSVLVDDESVVLAFLAAVLVLEGAAVARAARGVDGRWVKAGLGTLAVLFGLVWFGLELREVGTGDPLFVPVLAAVTGLWVLLDTRRDFVEGRRDGPSREDVDADDVLLVMNHMHLVGKELESGPKTVPELAAACDLTESRVREALDAASANDIVYHVDEAEGTPRYALDESKVGALAFVRENGLRVARRLVRPLRW